jgi:hypothetical protein
MLANSLGHYNDLSLTSQIIWQINWIIKGRSGHSVCENYFRKIKVEYRA